MEITSANDSYADGPAASVAGGPLVPSFPAWGLAWRSIVYVIGVGFVIPAPWAGVWYWKWFVSRIALPGGRPLRLEAKVSDIWYVFVGLGLVQWLTQRLERDLAGDSVQIAT